MKIIEYQGHFENNSRRCTRVNSSFDSYNLRAYLFCSHFKNFLHNIKICKKTTTTTLSSKINTTFYFGKQEEAHKSFRREWILRTARVVAGTFPIYDRMCCAFLKSPCKLSSLKPFSWIKTWVSKLTSLLFVSLSDSFLCTSFKSIITSIFKLNT